MTALRTPICERLGIRYPVFQAGLIGDVPTAGAVVGRVIAEAQAVLHRLGVGVGAGALAGQGA